MPSPCAVWDGMQPHRHDSTHFRTNIRTFAIHHHGQVGNAQFGVELDVRVSAHSRRHHVARHCKSPSREACSISSFNPIRGDNIGVVSAMAPRNDSAASSPSKQCPSLPPVFFLAQIMLSCSCAEFDLDLGIPPKRLLVYRWFSHSHSSGRHVLTGRRAFSALWTEKEASPPSAESGLVAKTLA